MPRYRFLQQSYIDGRIIEAGEEAEFDGYPGDHMVLVSGDPKAVDAANKAKFLAEAKLLGINDASADMTTEEIMQMVSDKIRRDALLVDTRVAPATTWAAAKPAT